MGTGIIRSCLSGSTGLVTNYAIDFAQPLYQGGKIRSAIHKADIEKQVAELQTLTDQAEIKLRLLNQYMNLFSLFKQHEVLARNMRSQNSGYTIYGG